MRTIGSVAVVMLSVSAPAGSVAENASENALAASFPLGAYWPWERIGPLAERNGLARWEFVERCLDDMKAHNMDTLWVVNMGIADLPELARRVAERQMKLIPALGELHYAVPSRMGNWEYLEAESRRAIRAAGDNPAILAWALCDEPRETFVQEMELYRGKFGEWGAKQPAVVVTMWHDTPVYAEQSGFPVVCPDLYPFFSKGVRSI